MERRLRTREELGMDQLSAESYFGLGNVVYTAAGFLYPDSRFAFVLSPDVESGRKVDASPWDSALFYRLLCPHLPAAPHDLKRREVFLTYTLPAPEYREYLVHYVATCFRSGHDYLSSKMPIFKDPLRAISDRFHSRVFEVRLGGSVPLETWSIEKIFVPQDSGDRKSLELRKFLEPFHRNKKIEPYESARHTLQHKVRTWLIERAVRVGRSYAR
jgi:hypothetical protein